MDEVTTDWTDNRWFPKWFTGATQEEKTLYDKVYSFYELFGDMLFQPETKTYELLKVKAGPSISREENGKIQIIAKPDEFQDREWEDELLLLPPEFQAFNYSCFHYAVKSLGTKSGCFDHQTLTLTVSPDELQNDHTILHEMIRMHEFVIRQVPEYYYDMLVWALYIDLKSKIERLDDCISGHLHVLYQSRLANAGGIHDLLFLLKSLDLDYKMHYPPGTVFAYGREREFQDLHFIYPSNAEE